MVFIKRCSIALKFKEDSENFDWKLLRKLLGEGLASCTLEELQQIERQLEKSVSNIRARKVHPY